MRHWEKIELVVATSWQPNENEFFRKLKIEPGSLAAQFFEGTFACLFLNSLNARREFEQYYSVEYGTLDHYLQARFGMVLDEEDLAKDNLFLCTRLSSVLDEGYDDNRLEDVLRCIHELENENEDQN
jgi:hypothetical protein